MFFEESSIRAGLTDAKYNIKLVSKEDIKPTAEQIKSAQEDSVMVDGNTLLKSHSVQGGYFYWMEDVKDLLQLNKQLQETQDYLVEEHAMLDASTKLEESKRRTKEQNRLYDEIAGCLKPQLDKLDEMLENMPQDENEFREKMKNMAFP